MDAHFWHERWQRGEIGFHQEAVNTHLQNFWHRINAPPRARVFVPLCGKSRDLLWLAGLGYEVVGVELSPIAVQAFFTENGLKPERLQIGAFEAWRHGEIQILHGDIFNLRRSDLAAFDAVYDRASLVALPPPMRQRYAEHLASLLPEGCGVLLVTMEYPQDQMNGPPFCVHEDEVRALFGTMFDVQVAHREDILQANPRFRERGLTQMNETVYLLRRNSA